MNLCYNQENVKEQKGDDPMLTAPPEAGVKSFAQLSALIRAADGLSLAQVCSLTGLEPSSVQNWIKRGFVPHPEHKRYRERHVARILLINALRECLLIERVGELMRYVNGNTDDTSDDLITEEALYDLFNAAVASVRDIYVPPELVGEKVAGIVSDMIADEAVRDRVIPAVTVMVNAHIAARYKREADRLYTAFIQS